MRIRALCPSFAFLHSLIRFGADHGHHCCVRTPSLLPVLLFLYSIFHSRARAPFSHSLPSMFQVHDVLHQRRGALQIVRRSGNTHDLLHHPQPPRLTSPAFISCCHICSIRIVCVCIIFSRHCSCGVITCIFLEVFSNVSRARAARGLGQHDCTHHCSSSLSHHFPLH